MIYEQALTLSLPEAAAEYEAESIRKLVSLCRELQRASGDRPFFLACRTAGDLLGISHILAAKWLRLLVMDGVLDRVTTGKRNRASEFRYLGD